LFRGIPRVFDLWTVFCEFAIEKVLDCCVNKVSELQIVLGTKTPRKSDRFGTNFNAKRDSFRVQNVTRIYIFNRVTVLFREVLTRGSFFVVFALIKVPDCSVHIVYEILIVLGTKTHRKIGGFITYFNAKRDGVPAQTVTRIYIFNCVTLLFREILTFGSFLFSSENSKKK
jgi:hypothetical protein